MKSFPLSHAAWLICVAFVTANLLSACSDDSGGTLYTTDDTGEADTSGADTSGADTSGTTSTDTSGSSGADTSGTTSADTSGTDTDTADACADSPCGPGTCTDAGNGAFTCDCAGTGFTGTACADDIDECAADASPCDPNATCTNTDGSFTCACNAPDYVGDGQTCVIALDCALGEATCDLNATCTDTGSGSFCTCNDGYDGDGVTCANVDECAADTSPCDPNATCADADGSFTCTCNAPDYVGDGQTCVVALDCALGEATCDLNASCIDTGSGSFCTCNDGYDGDGVTCANIDECAAATSPCDPNATCADTDGSFTCTCNAPDYVGDGQTCVIALDCVVGGATCDLNATCTDTGSGSFCMCNGGYAGDGQTCADTDGCAGDPCFAGVACADVPAPGTGFTCGACPSGYTGDGQTCADTDGCAGDPCFAGVTCADVPAPGTGFTCGACPTGYTGDGQTCADTNGCAGDPCFAGVACADVPAPGTGFTCGACPSGYTGDGQTCADIDGCAGDPCFAGVTCADVPAPGTGFACGACPSGYTGDGMTCADIDGCAGDPCFAGVTCADVPAPGTGFTCGACPSGYTGDGQTCADVNECTAGTDTCDPSALCTNTDGGFTCACPPGGADVNGDGTLCTYHTSCRTLRAADPTLPDGLYTIDTGTGGPVEVFCDMTSDGGVGYTMLRIDDPSLGTGPGSQAAYVSTCAALGMEIIVPRTKAHARAIQTYNGGNPNIVNVSPKADGAVGLSNWTGICQGAPCTFYMDDTNSAGCTNPEPNGDNTTQSRLYRRSDAGGCFFGNWNDANAEVLIGGSVVCSTNDASPAIRRSCYDALTGEAVYNAGPTGISGPYVIDPDGASGPGVPFTADCDMVTDGGGWTRVAHLFAGSRTVGSIKRNADFFTAPWAQNDATFTDLANNAAISLNASTYGMIDARALLNASDNDVRFSCQDTTRSRTVDAIWTLPRASVTAYLATIYAASSTPTRLSRNGGAYAAVNTFLSHSEGPYFGNWHICGSAQSGTDGFQLGLCHNNPTTGDLGLVDINQAAIGFHAGFSGLRLECGADTPTDSSLIQGSWSAWVRERP